jgi:hypothetical protein
MKITALLIVFTASIAIASPVAEPEAAPEALTKRKWLTQAFHPQLHYAILV